MSEISSDSGSTGAVESSESTGAAENSAAENENNEAEQAEGQEEGQSTPEPKKEAVTSLKKKLKLKVDGEEFEEEIDFNDEEGLARKLRMAKAAENRIAKAKTATAKAMEIIKAMEEAPESLFEKLGPKGREAAEKFLLKQIQEEMLTKEEKEARAEKEELERYRAEKKQSAEEKEKQAQAELVNKYAQEYQNTIITALEKSGLPKSPTLVKRMAAIMNKNLSLGLELTAEDLVLEVKNETTETLKALIKDADGDQLLQMFGEDIANKIRRSDLKKLTEKQSQVFNSPNKSASNGGSAKQNSDRPMTMAEWKEQVNKRIQE